MLQYHSFEQSSKAETVEVKPKQWKQSTKSPISLMNQRNVADFPSNHRVTNLAGKKRVA